MRTEQIALHSKLQMMEKSQIQELKLRIKDLEGNHKEISTNHKPPGSLNKLLSHCEEVTCPIEKGLVESGIVGKET